MIVALLVLLAADANCQKVCAFKKIKWFLNENDESKIPAYAFIRGVSESVTKNGRKPLSIRSLNSLQKKLNPTFSNF